MAAPFDTDPIPYQQLFGDSDPTPWADPPNHEWKYQYVAEDVDLPTPAPPAFTTQTHPEQSRPDRNFAMRSRAAAALVAMAPSLFFLDIPSYAQAVDFLVEPDPLPAHQPADRDYLQQDVFFVPAIATRFYLPRDGGFYDVQSPVRPALSGWTNTANTGFLPGRPWRMSTQRAPVSNGSGPECLPADCVADFETALNLAYVSDTLDDQVISGTFRGVMRAIQDFTDCHHSRVALSLKVVSNDGGIVRGTLLTLASYTPDNPFTTSPNPPQNRLIADGDALTPVHALLGDRLFFELGTSPGILPTLSDFVCLHCGDSSGVDLAFNATATDAYDPWVEFSQELKFKEVPAEVQLILYADADPQFDRISRDYLGESFLFEMDRKMATFVQAQPDEPLPARETGAHLDPSLFWHPDISGLGPVDTILQPTDPPQTEPPARGYLAESFATAYEVPPQFVPDFGWYARASEPNLFSRIVHQSAVARMPWLFIHELPVPNEPVVPPPDYERCPAPSTEYDRCANPATTFDTCAGETPDVQRLAEPTTSFTKRAPPTTDYER